MTEGISALKFYASLENRLSQGLPGLSAQLFMVPDPRPGSKVYTEVQDFCLRAGVLILLYPKEDTLSVVLTRRTEKLERHQAQISFPGGRQEEGESLEQTALRETCEELGIDPVDIRIIGQLTPLYIPPTNYCIYPVVARMDKIPHFFPSAFEVAEVLEIPLEHLLDPKTVHREKWTLRGAEVSVPFYLYQGHKIWGATAMVLAEFLELGREAQKE